MKTERLTRNPQPITPIRGGILGRLELLFVRDRKAAGGHRRLVARYALPGDRRDVEIFAPTIDAAWRTACRVSKRERNKQRREELGNERAAKIQKRLGAEDRRKRAAEYRPDLNLTIKREWLDMIILGTKREEYRAADNRQCLRLWRECESVGHFPLRPIVAVLRAGYTMDSRAAAVLVRYVSRRFGIGARTYPRGVNGFSIHNFIADSTCGEPIDAAHFALGLESVLCSGPYSDVKAQLGWRLFVEGADHA